MTNKTILLIEDSESDQALARAALEPEGFVVHVAGSAEAALESFDDLNPGLVLLDVMLPGMDGLGACRELRMRSPVPIIMLTGKAEEVDKVVGLELGADDYLAKPYGARELVARVRAMLRRVSFLEQRGAPLRQLSYPGLEIDAPTRSVRLDGKLLVLTPKEFDLLFYLASQPNRVASREELMERVWGRTAGESETRTVDTHIKRLRQKLEEQGNFPWSLSTVWGVGYRFQTERN